MSFVDSLLRRLSRRLIYQRKSPRRRPASVPTRFRVASGANVSSFVEVRTRDLSATGLAVETPSLRVDGMHVYNSMDMVTPTRLDIVLGLPSGNVTIRGETVRYDSTDDATYLLGIQILEMADDDRRRYEEFLDTLKGR
ncbi:MAG TPA: PilZ domain-containing protein [Blastocatellia bacterium]|nr:PilZ domain-containing protein [Blastocatellia bacterium]